MYDIDKINNCRITGKMLTKIYRSIMYYYDGDVHIGYECVDKQFCFIIYKYVVSSNLICNKVQVAEYNNHQAISQFYKLENSETLNDIAKNVYRYSFENYEILYNNITKIFDDYKGTNIALWFLSVDKYRYNCVYELKNGPKRNISAGFQVSNSPISIETVKAVTSKVRKTIQEFSNECILNALTSQEEC